MPSSAPEWYCFTRGDPLRHPRRQLRRVTLLVAVAYLPVLVLALGWGAATGHWTPALAELTTHVRPLVVLPLLCAAELLMEERAGIAGRYLLGSQLLGPDSQPPHRRVIARTARLRDSAATEVALLALALASVVFSPAPTREPEPVIRLGLQPAALLYRFLFLRILWRWALWALYLRRLARLPLALCATHPDRVGGLEPIAGPSLGFAVLAMAAASSAAAAWGDRMRFDGVAAGAFGRAMAAFAVTAAILAVAPLWVFTPRLIQLRKRGVNAYGAFASRYARAFERRWFDRAGEDALGAPDIQSLGDLGGSFERVQRIRVVVAPRAVVTTVLAAALLPMLPLILAEVGLSALLVRLGRAIL